MATGTEMYARYLRGDNGALEELVVKYGDGLIGYAYCYLRDFAAAEDVMEDVFAALIVKRKKFDECSALEAYLFRIARNKCIDRLRKRGRESFLDDELPVASAQNVEEEVLQTLRDEKVYKALLGMPKDYRDVLYLSYYQGFSVDDIKSAMRKTTKQVYNLTSRAKAALKQILIKEGIGYEDL